MMKNMKVTTKLTVVFVFVDLLIIAALYSGYATAHKVVGYENPEQYLKSFKIFSGICFVAMMVLMSGIILWIRKVFDKTLTQLVVAAKKLSIGDLDITIEKHSDDEFGELIEAVQKLVAHNKYLESVLEEAAGGNMVVEVKVESEKDALGKALKTLIENNFKAITSVKDAISQVMTSSSQVASASESLAQGSTEQASAIQQVTASINDVAEKTKNNAEEANQAKRSINNVIAEVQNGNQQMEEMMNAMNDINKSSEGVYKIIKVIDDIAFQTNILALNAAVEAARAGEAGKGFAVVAEEVRNLAAKCASAAAETAEMIENSIEKIGTGSQIADATFKSLEIITKEIKQSGKIVDEITEASNYQATAITQIDQAITQVSEVVQTNSATSEECAAASIELSSQAKGVLSLLAAYNLGAQSVTSLDTSFDYMPQQDTGAYRNEQIISLGDGFGKY